MILSFPVAVFAAVAAKKYLVRTVVFSPSMTKKTTSGKSKTATRSGGSRGGRGGCRSGGRGGGGRGRSGQYTGNNTSLGML